MKKYIYNFIPLILFVFSLAFTGCDENGQIDSNDIRTNVLEPQIKTFSPSAGSPGTEVALTGVNLSTVDSVYIGGALAKVKNRISNTQLLIEVTANSKSGKISIKNPKGTYESNDIFDVYILKPEIDEIKTQVAGEITAGEIIAVNGKNLRSVKSVTIANSGSNIIFASDSELKVLAPFVTGVNSGKVILSYFNGSDDTPVESSQSFKIKTPTLVPAITEAPATATIGETITLKGTNLNTVSSVVIGNKTIELTSRSNTEITLVIPTTFGVETKTDLILIYNGTEQVVGVKNFVVTVPVISDEVLFYPNLILGAEGNNNQQYFFNPVNGIIYSACEFDNNKNNIYFFVSSYTSGSTIQFNNPNNSATQTSRFLCGEVALPEGKLTNVVKFKVLKATTSAEKVYIDMVKKRTLGKISPSIISGAGISNATTSTPRVGTNFNVGDVLLFQKFDATGVTVEKVGFIDVVEINMDAANLGQSSITFNCFFQK